MCVSFIFRKEIQKGREGGRCRGREYYRGDSERKRIRDREGRGNRGRVGEAEGENKGYRTEGENKG